MLSGTINYILQIKTIVIQRIWGDIMEGMAIIGMGCRFPGGANDPEKYWDVIINGIDATKDVPEDRWSKRIYHSKDKSVPGKLSAFHGGFLDRIDKFDAEFFGISPREASYIDPQQRLLLEVSWEAMEDAGIIPESLKGKDVGVYIGAFTVDYKILQFKSENRELIDAHSSTGMMMTILSNRISYIYDFKGPSMTVDTACSSSLVALHLACQAIRNGECSIALVGGVNIMTTPDYTISESKGGFLSPDGRSKAFDSSANGYARGEGAGIVVIKSLSKALADGDNIYAVIKGTGINHDGHTNGITVPSGEAQERLLKEVYEKAGILPGQVCYFEAHGTGTPVGDPIEANAVANVLKIGRREPKKCFVGSVKTNIVHLEPAAGVAGLIKACLVLKNRMIPPHLHFKNPNPKIPFEDLCIRVPTKPEPLTANGEKAIIGINSFGFGGTNSHAIIEEPPHINKEKVYEFDTESKPSVVTISGHTENALYDASACLKNFIESNLENTDVPFNDLCYTLVHRRSHHEYRLSFPARNKLEMKEYLEAFINREDIKEMSYGKSEIKKYKEIVFVYTGMGPIWWAMGRQLFQKEAVFREAIEKCDNYIHEFAGWSVIEELLADEETSRLDQPQYAQPANFAVQVGLTELWLSLGVIPCAVVGHSVGEIAAAYASGRLDLKQASKVSVERSRVQQKAVGQGTMLAVGLSEAEAKKLIEEFNEMVSIAAINSNKSVTLSGDAKGLEVINGRLQQQGVFSRFMKVNVAYHSYQMDPYKEELLEALKDIKPQKSLIPIYSTVSGKICEGEEYGAEYWWRNIRQPVRFEEAIDNLIKDNHRLFIEIGPHPVLAGSIKECMDKNSVEGKVVHSIRRNEDEQKIFYGTMGQLYVLGIGLELDRVCCSSGNLVKLPLYPWQRERYWFESEESLEQRTGMNNHFLLGRRLKISKPTWESDLNPEIFPFLRDHRIQNSVVFPGAAYIEWALAFIKEHYKEERCFIEKITFNKALFIKEGKYPIIQFAYNPDNRIFEIYSREPGEEKNWVLNASGKVSRLIGGKETKKLYPDSIKEELTEEVGRQECYELFQSLGFDYGYDFQGVDKLYKGKGKVLSRIKVPDTVSEDLSLYNLHPAILDSCFQGMIAALTTLDDVDYKNKLYLPIGLDSIILRGKPDVSMWGYTEISEKGEDYIKGDIYLVDNNGNITAQINGFNVRETSGANSSEFNSLNNLYNLEWMQYTKIQEEGMYQNSNQVVERRGPDNNGMWLIFEDSTGIGKQLSAELESRGKKCISVVPGDKYNVLNNGCSFCVNPSEEKDFDDLFDYLYKHAGIPFEGILHLWNLNSICHDKIDSTIIKELHGVGCISVMNLVKAVERNQTSAKIWILTRGAHTISGKEKEYMLLQAPAWGIGRVIGYQEMPGIFGGLIDLDPEETKKDVEYIIKEIYRKDSENQVAYREGCRYVPRLVESKTNSSKLPIEFKPDKSYLLTGAFGALGMLTAKWMIKNGARRLILMSRTEFPDRQMWGKIDRSSQLGKRVEFLHELEALGAVVHLAYVDVSDQEEINSYINEYYENGWPDIAGVIHTAGIVRDKLIRDMDISTFIEVLKPKVLGSWNLHKAFEFKKPDFFVLFSSVSSVLNVTMGQSNYASANMFIDALANYRRSIGLPAVSINWGPWSQVGMASTLDLTEYFEKRGIGSISPKSGMQIISDLLDYDEPQVIVLPAKWPLLCANFQQEHVPSMIAYLGQREDKNTDTERGNKDGNEQDYLNILLSCKQDEMAGVLQNQLLTLIAKIFRIDSSKLDVSESLSLLGMDSMMATEIINRIQMTYNLSLSMVELMQGISIEELSEKMADLLEPSSQNKIEKEDKYPLASCYPENLYEPFPVTEVQKAYFTGRDRSFVLGGVGTHIYMEVKSELDIERINKALNILIKRHPMMRCVFQYDGMQKILESVPEYRIGLKDISGMNETEQNKEILRLRAILSHQVFDPLTWPLFNISALRLSEKENYLFISLDMLNLDGTSWQMIGHELIRTYDNSEIEVQDVKFTFRDYMLAYSEFKKSRTYQGDKEYWLSKLENFPNAPDIPLKRNPEDIDSPHFKRLSKIFKKEDWEKIKKLANKNNISPSALLCTAYAMTLAYWSNQNSLAINTTVFNRYPFNKDVDKLVGDFTSIVVLGIDLNTGTSFWDKAKSVQNVLIEAIEHKHYDGIEFIRELSRTKSIDNNLVTPIVFTSMLTNAGYGMEGWHKFGKVQLELSQTPQVYLDNQLHEVDDELHITWDYVEDLFYEEDIFRMYEQYIDIITQLVEQGDFEQLKLAKGDIEIIERYNNTDKVMPKTTLHQLFSKQSVDNPENIAVKYGNNSITYRELDEKSDCVAGYLREQGIGRNNNVAVLGERCIETIINILGILKAGAAYVPLDPDYPEERKRYIMDNSGSMLLLTPNLLSEYDLSIYKVQAPKEYDNIEDVAYVIYTSGSTGRPKGVVTTHCAVTNTIIDINEKFNVNKEDKMVWLSSLCFDLSVYDIFGALSTGASLVLIPDLKDVQELIQTVKREQITIWNSVPSIMDMMIDSIEYSSMQSIPFWQTDNNADLVIEYSDNSSLRLVMLSGDWIPLGLPDRIRDKFDNAEIVSLGGATEASIWSIYYPIGNVREDWKSIPYGIPLSNQKFYVLNADLEFCPVDVSGELFIGGIGLASGYIGDEEKTRNAFITHPRLGRIYRTGDMGVLRREGYIEFKGRKDQQIKIRGHRIELGEIENCLMEIDGIKNAAVVDVVDSNGAKFLCAYVVCKSELDTKEIKGYLLNKLPEYMVPFHYRIIDSIPLSSNGKVDRKALPKFKPDICNDKELILPRNDMEKRLAEICGKLLEIDILSINDNLYDLGWDSVRMISLASKIQHDFGVKIPFRIMMENPTIKAVSQFISNADNGDENIVTLLNQKHQRNIFAFPPVSSYGFVYKELAGKLNNCSLYSFDFIEDEDIIKLYTDEILKIQDNGAYVLLGFCGGGNIAFEVAKELFSRGHKVTDIILLDAYYSLENAIVQMDSQIKTKFKQSTLDILNQKYSNKFSVDSLFDKGIRVKIDNYMDMIVKTCSSDGDVSSDIHYVCAEGDMEYKAFLREKAHKWSSLTTGKFNWYNGSGKHDEMLLDRFVGKNAEVLRKILNKITA